MLSYKYHIGCAGQNCGQQEKLHVLVYNYSSQFETIFILT